MPQGSNKVKIGEVYGTLTVMSETRAMRAENTKTPKIYYYVTVECSCGVQKEVHTSTLFRRGTVTCGDSYHKIKNLQGQRFGRLFVLTIYGPPTPPRKAWKWFCVCDCGNYHIVDGNALEQGQSKSCGCLNKGKTSYHYKGNRSLRQEIRDCQEMKNWKVAVFTRDGRACQNCFASGRKANINAHHINYLSTMIADYNITTVDAARICLELWNIENGITLCEDCHKNTHQSASLKLEVER